MQGNTGIAVDDGSIRYGFLRRQTFWLIPLKGRNSFRKGIRASDITIASYRADAEPLSAEDIQTPADSQAELEEEVRNLIYRYIPHDAKEIGYVMIALYVIAALVLLSMIPWVYLFIKILFKSFMKNPSVKLKAPILFGWLPFLLFMAIPNLAIFLLPMLYPTESLPFVFQISVMSASVIAFLAAVALILISFGYGRFAKRSKSNGLWTTRFVLSMHKQFWIHKKSPRRRAIFLIHLISGSACVG